jgi:hypothetical protein
MSDLPVRYVILPGPHPLVNPAKALALVMVCTPLLVLRTARFLWDVVGVAVLLWLVLR